MKLLFDLGATQPNDSGKSHGGGKYGIIVFFALIERGVPMECAYDARLPLREDVRQAAEKNNIPLIDICANSLNAIAKERRITAFYSASSISPAIDDDSVRNIITMHGLRNLEMPRDWWFLKYKLSPYLYAKNFIILALNGWWKKKMQNRMRRALLNSKVEYVVVSEHTKYSCLSHVPELDPNRLKVFYSPSTSSASEAIAPYPANFKYILLVSANRPEKNALRAIAAIDELISENECLKDFKTIVTGSKGNDFYFKIKNKGSFIFLGYVDEPTLESLYKGASLFVYPSINEGFGYPPLEAMHYGVPVAASPITSISEVCGDAALYFNPFDYKEIKGRILRMLTDADCRKEYSKRGLDRFRQITSRQNQDLSALIDFIASPKKATTQTHTGTRSQK